MWKSSLLLLCLLPGLAGAVASLSNPDDYIRSRTQPKQVDRELWRREVTTTLALLDALSLQLKSATPDEVKEVWSSGVNEFRMTKSVVEKCRKAIQFQDKAAALEAQPGASPEKVAGLRQDARDAIKSFHKGAKQEFLDELRNWISVSEGILRKARKKEAAKP